MYSFHLSRAGTLAAGILVALIVALTLPLGTARAANVIYVVPNGVGSSSGSDWANATTLQNALSIAATGDQIWVRAGTYLPGTDRAARFALKSGVAIYGGFAGIESSLNQRNPSANTTILSGDIGAPGDPSDNSYHVVVGWNVDQQTLLDGFTITGANTNGSLDTFGGGVQLYQSYATIRNCILQGNSAETGGAIGASSGYPVFSHLLVSDNQATYGGGLAIDTAIVTLVTFRNNHADYGGALEIESGNPVISQVLVTGNQATYWGGGILIYQSNPVIRQATLAGNSALNGGAIALQETTLTMRNSIVWGSGSDPIAISQTGVVDIGWSTVEGGYAGVGNSAADPRFVNAVGTDGVAGTADDDLHLQSISPAIDSGNNADIPADLADIDGDGDTSEPISSDLDGHARVVNGTVDQGVYEASSLPSPTPTATSSPTPTKAATPTATASQTPTRSPTPTVTVNPALTVSPTRMATTSPTPTQSPTPTATSSPTPTGSLVLSTTATPHTVSITLYLPLMRGP